MLDAKIGHSGVQKTQRFADKLKPFRVIETAGSQTFKTTATQEKEEIKQTNKKNKTNEGKIYIWFVKGFGLKGWKADINYSKVKTK